MTRRMGILTGGGDCPGLNAVIRAVVRKGLQENITCYGFPHGWRGVIDNEILTLGLESTRGILHRGGTMLGTSRVDPYREGAVEAVKEMLEVHRLDGLIVIGGEGTLSGARELFEKDDVPIIGVPKTIDNDVDATDLTVGFTTAVDIATDAVDRLHTTAESHDRVMVLETMGRHAGWIAAYAGIAGGADAILIPEFPFHIDGVTRHIKQRAGSGRDFSIVVVAEGAQPAEGTMELPDYEEDQFGRPRLGGIGHTIAHEIEQRTGFESRVTILGHVQRGGTPVPTDRVLATRFGVRAVELALDGQWGTMTALQAGDVVAVSLADATDELATVPRELIEVAEVFFG